MLSSISTLCSSGEGFVISDLFRFSTGVYIGSEKTAHGGEDQWVFDARLRTRRVLMGPGAIKLS